MKYLVLGLTALLTFPLTAEAHDRGSAQYLANEGVMVTSGEIKIMFDPLFDNGFDNYPLVPAEMKVKMLAGEAPFDGIDILFVSHAHGDHFAAAEMIDYLFSYPDITLVAPPQALVQMKEAANWQEQLLPRITAIAMSNGEEFEFIVTSPKSDKVIARVEKIRVPHIGAMHAAVENYIYRVSLNDATVMHLGDATADTDIYQENADIFRDKQTHMAFPPHWFYSMIGSDDTKQLLRADHLVGIHVPIEVPKGLKNSGEDYFSVPGETRKIGKSHTHD